MVRHLIITLEVLKTSILFGWLMERALTFFCNIGRRVPDVVHLGNFYQIMHEWWGKFLFTLGFLLNLPIFHYGPLPLLKPAFESNINSKKNKQSHLKHLSAPTGALFVALGHFWSGCKFLLFHSAGSLVQWQWPLKEKLSEIEGKIGTILGWIWHFVHGFNIHFGRGWLPQASHQG